MKQTGKRWNKKYDGWKVIKLEVEKARVQEKQG